MRMAENIINRRQSQRMRQSLLDISLLGKTRIIIRDSAARRAFLMDADPRGSFSFLIPFEHVFGFTSYNKVICNMKHLLELVRYSMDNEAKHRGNGTPDGKINLTGITWRVPHVKLEVGKLMQ